MYYKQVLDKVSLFGEQKAHVSKDVNLSPAGKERALKNLRDSMVAYVRDATILLSADWKETRKAYESLAGERLQALEDERRSWNYQVLNYETNRVRSLVMTPGFSAEELYQAWNQVKAEGNREGVRAFVESLPVIVGRSWNVAPGDTVSELKTAGKTLRMTPKLERLEAGQKALELQAEELYQATLTVSGWVEAVAPGLNDVRNLLSDVNREYKVNPETLEESWRFTFQPVTS